MSALQAFDHITPLQAVTAVDQLGTKGTNLRWLQQNKATVPSTFVCGCEVYRHYKVAPEETTAILRAQLMSILQPDQKYAIRSSANVEDGVKHSFAGQFTTKLDVQGVDAVIHAIQEVYDSIDSDHISTYLTRTGLSADSLCMSVLIQEMVKPVISGVAFSRNPLTGLNEIVIEAVQGTGDSLVSGGSTPDRWVRRWGRWILQPTHDAIEPNVPEVVAEATSEIARNYGEPVDLEWVYDGDDVYWIQMRPITAMDDIPIYSNRISREFLPGLIKPLIWSINIPLVNSAWVRLITEIIGPNDIQPEDLSKAFHYRAYFNMGTIGRVFKLLGFPEDTLELLMGFEKGPEAPSYQPTLKTMRVIPRVIGFLASMVGYDRRVEQSLTDLEPAYAPFRIMNLDRLSEEELLEGIDELFQVNLEIVYHNILIPLQQSIYTAVFRKSLERQGIDFTSFDLTDGMEEIETYDPGVHIARLKQLFDELDPEVQSSILDEAEKSLAETPTSNEFHEHLSSFIDRFGHFSESGNDFSSRPWRENTSQVVQMISQQGENLSRQDKITWPDINVGTIPRFYMTPLFKKARKYRLQRERVSSLYTYGYGLFRDYFISLGERFQERGVIASREDIFYLYMDEVRQIVHDGEYSSQYISLVEARKQEMEQARDVDLPEIIYGDQPPPLKTLKLDGIDHFPGIATSRGYYEGPVRVIQHLDQISKLEDGDVLVIPYSDVAWTPLFQRAGAVVSESGGMLSHSSIVARELGIPCVVSVQNATRMKDGTMVLVDGVQGAISLVEPGS